MIYTENAITELKNKIINTIAEQGFSINGKVIPLSTDKSVLKNIHLHARKEQLMSSKKFLKEEVPLVRNHLLDRKNLDPDKIDLRLVEVQPDTDEAKLYRWWNLMWWSMPYQRAYGRQMRFLIWDDYHNAPFGLIGLQSPVLKMSVRDDYLKIPKTDLDVWVNRSMQAQRVGALPPYNELIGGKMVGLTLGTNEIRTAYRAKYSNKETLIEKRNLDANLLFITTSSAYGRSSIYNRLKWNDDKIAVKLGYTKGFGTFHVPESVFVEIKEFLESKGINTATTFGNGPSKKIKLLYQAFSKLGLPNYSKHEIKREYYLFPHVSNLHEVISNNEMPDFINRPFDVMVQYWKQRWCIPRWQRMTNWSDFTPNNLILEAEKL